MAGSLFPCTQSTHTVATEESRFTQHTWTNTLIHYIEEVEKLPMATAKKGFGRNSRSQALNAFSTFLFPIQRNVVKKEIIKGASHYLLQTDYPSVHHQDNSLKTGQNGRRSNISF